MTGKGSIVNETLQPPHTRTECPFLASLVCVAQLKLLLLRARGEAPTWHKRRCVDKVLDGLQLITQAIESLTRTDSGHPEPISDYIPPQFAPVVDQGVTAGGVL
jgi:hypothetical protein